jgi:hypothetical protein
MRFDMTPREWRTSPEIRRSVCEAGSWGSRASQQIGYLFSDGLAGAAELGGKVLQFG